jgi:hypothetical protein
MQISHTIHHTTLPVKILFEKRLVKIANSISAFPLSESRNIFSPQENPSSFYHLPSTIFPLPSTLFRLPFSLSFSPTASFVQEFHNVTASPQLLHNAGTRIERKTSAPLSPIFHLPSPIYLFYRFPVFTPFSPFAPLYFPKTRVYFSNARRNL